MCDFPSEPLYTRNTFGMASPLAARAHVIAHAMNECQRTRDVGINDLGDVLEVLIKEGVSETLAGIRQQGVDRASFDRFIKFVDAFGRRQIGLNCFNFHADLAELICRLDYLRFVGRHD